MLVLTTKRAFLASVSLFVCIWHEEKATGEPTVCFFLSCWRPQTVIPALFLCLKTVMFIMRRQAAAALSQKASLTRESPQTKHGDTCRQLTQFIVYTETKKHLLNCEYLLCLLSAFWSVCVFFSFSCCSSRVWHCRSGQRQLKTRGKCKI